MDPDDIFFPAIENLPEALGVHGQKIVIELLPATDCQSFQSLRPPALRPEAAFGKRLHSPDQAAPMVRLSGLDMVEQLHELLQGQNTKLFGQVALKGAKVTSGEDP